MPTKQVPLALLAAITAASCAHSAPIQLPTEGTVVPVLWRAPEQRRSGTTTPRPPFRFVEEDFSGDSPKFTVVDGNDAEWKVKLGPEAHTEIPAATLLAATGYFADDMHYVERAPVAGLDRLKRGREYLEAGGYVREAQFEARPTHVIRGANWEWSRNPFAGTEPLDGLRVLMVLINNYDARSANNHILETVSSDGARESRYVVTDLGASFGRYGGLGGHRSKRDLTGYRESPFIAGVRNGSVEFAYRTRPEGFATTLFVFNPFYTSGELKKERDLNRVPLSGTRWITRLLQQVEPATIRSGFEAAGYSPEDAAGFTQAVEDRIRQLAAL